jgi:hypothetical protein
LTTGDALYRGFTEPVRDVLWGHIYFTSALEELAKSPPFIRLYRILQLGPAYAVYPGATHTRASHSIGVYYLARRLLINLAEQGRRNGLVLGGYVLFSAPPCSTTWAISPTPIRLKSCLWKAMRR